MNKILFAASLIFLVSLKTQAQDTSDSSYYDQYQNDFISRVYVSKKYNFFEVKQKSSDNRLLYRPNTSVNLGVGVTYRKFSLNIALGFGFLNPEQGKGKTKKLDLQSRLYGRKWLIDLSGEFFNGYYLYPRGKDAPTARDYYLRPDLSVNVVGISAYRLFNSKRMTFRNGIIHDEWQKKSAGSLLAGGSIHYAGVDGDSSVIPLRATRDFGGNTLLGLRNWMVAGGLGYAYTLILPAHFYVSGALVGELNFGLVKETSANMSHTRFSVTPTISHKLAAGYFDGNWGVGAFWINNRLSAKGYSGNSYLLNTGVMRIIVSKRFTASPRTKKKLAPVDKLLDLVLKPDPALP